MVLTMTSVLTSPVLALPSLSWITTALNNSYNMCNTLILRVASRDGFSHFPRKLLLRCIVVHREVGLLPHFVAHIPFPAAAMCSLSNTQSHSSRSQWIQSLLNNWIARELHFERSKKPCDRFMSNLFKIYGCRVSLIREFMADDCHIGAWKDFPCSLHQKEKPLTNS